jgi:hypothetical protein
MLRREAEAPESVSHAITADGWRQAAEPEGVRDMEVTITI